MWHHFYHEVLEKNGVAFMQEINVSPWLPEGWGGIADWLFWNDKYRAFHLSDLKSIKGEGLKWVADGAKEDHLYQLSAYFHGLVDAKFPMMPEFSILYLPMNDTTDKYEVIAPIIAECEPLSRDHVFGMMEERGACTRDYLATIDAQRERNIRSSPPVPIDFVTDQLAEPMPRVHKCMWLKTKGLWEVKMVPHWSAMYCPYTDELCECNTGGVTKIGEWALTDGELVYTPRAGYGEITPQVKPEPADVRKRLREVVTA